MADIEAQIHGVPEHQPATSTTANSQPTDIAATQHDPAATCAAIAISQTTNLTPSDRKSVV